MEKTTMEEKNQEFDYYTLTDENGNETEYELIGTCEMNGNKYYALIPADTAEDAEPHQHGENLIGLLVVAHTKCFGNQCRSAGTYHESYRAKNHDVGHDQINGGKGCLSCEIRNKNTVYHTVNRCKYHHHDGWQRKSQELPVCKMV